jgi:hypothetical protein
MTVEAGQTLYVPADHRYGFRTTGPFDFVNYRADVSSITHDPKEPPRLETVAAATAHWQGERST